MAGTTIPAITRGGMISDAPGPIVGQVSRDVHCNTPQQNPIESLNAKLRRAVRTRGHFPTDDNALKLLFLVLNLAEREWKMPSREWVMVKAQLAILFEDRFTLE